MSRGKRKRQDILSHIYSVLELHGELELSNIVRILDTRTMNRKYKISNFIVAAALRGADRITRKRIWVNSRPVIIYSLNDRKRLNTTEDTPHPPEAE